MNIRTVLTAFTIFFATQFSHAQTAAEIVDKHIKAIGGNALIASIKSQETENTITVMGSSLTSKVTLLTGKGWKSVGNFDGKAIIQCITPKAGWMRNELAGITEPQELPAEQVKAGQILLFPVSELYQYKEKGSSVTFEDTATLDGVSTYKLKLKNKEGAVTTFFIDAKTHFLVRRESSQTIEGEELKSFTNFSNFKKTDIGYYMPFTSQTENGFQMTTTVEKVVFNQTVDPKIFEMPKQ